MKAHFCMQACLFISLVFLPLSPMSGQGWYSRIVWLKISDDVGGHDSLVFGNLPTATYCVDTALGENQSPPYPPGFSAVFMGIPGRVNCFSSLGLIKRDFRPLNFPSRVDTFDIQFQNNDSVAECPEVAVTLRWPDADYLTTQMCDSIIMFDRAGGTVIPTRIDMLEQDSVVLKGLYNPMGCNPSAPIVKVRIIKYAGYTIEAAGDQNQPFPKTFTLKQNYPNPFNPSTRIDYALPSESHVGLEIFNTLGQSVAVLKNGIEPGGYKSVTWDASHMTSGIYLYRLEAISTSGADKRFVQVRKLILLR